MLARVAGPRLVREWHLVRPRPASYGERLEWDALPYMSYAYGLQQAVLQARALGLAAISAVELGVAGGRGLVALEEHAAALEHAHGVRIDIAGFTLPEGMPPAAGPKDLPYVWRSGYFRTDLDALRGRLRRAELVLGDVAETVPRYHRREPGPAPLGFASFDLDYHSSTVTALELLRAPHERTLPRVFCHFDDVIGSDAELHSPYAGQLLAIEEFNAAGEDKLAKIHALTHKRRLPAGWHEQLHVLHRFGHPRYGEHLGAADWQLALP